MTDIMNCITISDTHVGCKVGLMSPSGYPLDDDNWYHPGATQLAIWKAWDEFWTEWVPMVTRGEPFVVVCNGDLIDGVHHRSVSQWSHDISMQRDAAIDILNHTFQPFRDKGLLQAVYCVNGTEAHVGASSQDDRVVARGIGAVPNSAGMHSRGDLYLTLGGDRCLIHFAHHIGTTSSFAYEATAIQKELQDSYFEAARWGERPPDVVVRSHRHRHIRTIVDGHNGDVIGCVTPCWQGKTPFVYKIPGGRITLPQIGGVCIRVGDEEHFVRAFTRTLPRSTVEVAGQI